jgi:hypothetical protein
MKHLVFLLEEPSAKEMLDGLLPRLLPGKYNELRGLTNSVQRMTRINELSTTHYAD